LELISPKNHDSMNSTFGNRPDVDRQTSIATIHPDDAAPRGIRTGDPVHLFNDRGECTLEARVEPEIPAGVVCVPSSRWGKSVNALVSERLTDLGNGPTFYSCLVDLEKAAVKSNVA
jgi:anaerobic selenocysteine-containing dehydrogenase